MTVLAQSRSLLILSLLGLWAASVLAPVDAHAQTLKCKAKAEESDLDGCCIAEGLTPRTTPALSFLTMGAKKDGCELYCLRSQHPSNPLVEARSFHDPDSKGRKLWSNVARGRHDPVSGQVLHGDDQPCEDPRRGCRSDKQAVSPIVQKGDEAACWRGEKLVYASYTSNENSATPETPGSNPLRAYGDADRLCNKINNKRPPPDAYANVANPNGKRKNGITGRPMFSMKDKEYNGDTQTPEATGPVPAVKLEEVSDAQAKGGAQQFISILMGMLKRFTANSFQSAGKTGFEDVGQRALTGLPMVSMFSTFLSPPNFQGNWPAILADRKGSLGFIRIPKKVGAVVVTPAYAVYDPNDFRPGQELELAEKVAEKTPEEWAAAKSFGLSVTNEALAAPGAAAGMAVNLVERFKKTTVPEIFRAIYKEEGGEYIKNITNAGDFNPLLSGWDKFSGIIPSGGLNMQNILGMLVSQLSGALQQALKGEIGKQKLAQQHQDVQNQFFDGLREMVVNDLGQDAQQLIPPELRHKQVKDLPANLQAALRDHYANKQISHNGANEQQLLSAIINQFNVGALLGGGGGGGGGAAAALQNAMKNALQPLSERLRKITFQDLFKTNYMQIMRGDHPYAPMQHALFRERNMYSPCASGDCYATRNFKCYGTEGRCASAAPVWPAYYPKTVENGMQVVRFAGSLQSKETGGVPMGTMIQPQYEDLTTSFVMQRIHYNRWCHADPAGCCQFCSCPPKPCPPEIPCWSRQCWGVRIGFESPPCAMAHNHPHDIAWELKDRACNTALAPSSCRYCHHPRLKTKRPNPKDRPLGFWAVASKADLDLDYDIKLEDQYGFKALSRLVTQPLPTAQKLAFCDTAKAEQRGQYIGDGLQWVQGSNIDRPYPQNPETRREFGQAGPGPVNLLSQRGAEVFVCANKDPDDGVQVASNETGKPHLNLAGAINSQDELNMLISSSLAAAQAPAGKPTSQCSYGGLGGKTGGCAGQTGTGPIEGQFGELMMHQMHTFRIHGLRCMPKYERAFMPWDQSGRAADAMGATVNPVSTDKAPWVEDTQGGGERAMTRAVRMTARCFGHLTEADPSKAGAPFKHIAKWEQGGLDGIAKIQRASASGAVIHGPRGFDEKAATILMPDLALAIRAGKDETGDFIDVVRFNGGRFPDACGLTSDLGVTHFQRWRKGAISQVAQKDNQDKKRRAGSSCSDTSVVECSVGEQWATLQWFDLFNCQNRNDPSCQQAANTVPGKDAVAEAQ